MAEEAAGGGIRRKLAGKQGARHQVVQPQRRRRALQRAPGRRAARGLRLAVGAAQIGGQPRRGAEHHRLRPAGQVGERDDGQVGTDHAVVTPPAAASARQGAERGGDDEHDEIGGMGLCGGLFGRRFGRHGTSSLTMGRSLPEARLMA
jgi:hypothetical protein